MKAASQWGRWGAVVVVGVAACEVLIMISPFAGFFYATVSFEPFLGLLSSHAATAWLDGFFLNHAVVTRSALLEGQREIGLFVFALGLWGFFISAAQVYGNKVRRKGVATGLLYRLVRHPQYLSLAVAGWGLLTIWPRFLLLGCWVTMMFLYAGLARFEERRMEERFGEDYRRFAATRGAFLPGSPVRRLFEASFGRVRPRALGWAAAYAACLALAFAGGFALRAHTRASTALTFQPGAEAVVISNWPQPEDWIARVFQTASADERVQQELPRRAGHPVVAHILPPKYVMDGMFYKMPPEEGEAGRMALESFRVGRLARLTVRFLLPVEGWTRNSAFMGVDPDGSEGPVEVVFSRAAKPYKENLALDEALDASVRLTPLVVAVVRPTSGEVAAVRVPLPQNAWGPQVAMPLF